jgi:hypothetical protein
VKSPKVHGNPTLPFSKEEMQRILEACDRYPRRHFAARAFVLMMRHQGCESAIPERSVAVAAHSSSQIVRREMSGYLTARLASLDGCGLELGRRRRLFGRRGTLTAES